MPIYRIEGQYMTATNAATGKRIYSWELESMDFHDLFDAIHTFNEMRAKGITRGLRIVELISGGVKVIHASKVRE